ncbi:MAG: hypothetical protein LBQ88_16000 [Treponema sp.]|nr:hypothetical protein [Treponema sp.]
MKKLLYLLFAVCCAAAVQAQSDPLYRGKVAAKITELTFEGKSALWFSSADTGLPLEGARVSVENAGVVITDADGLAVFPTPADGVHNFLVEKSGFMRVEDSFTVTFGSIMFNKYSIPPAAPLEYVKVVLDWSKEPADLDLHVVKENRYHISFHDMKKAADGTAWLDRDDQTGYGPETVTITQTDNNAVYQIYIHDYSNRNQKNSPRLSRSQAVVRIYNNNTLAERYTITPGKTGTTWRVCGIVNGKIEAADTYE